MARKKGKSRSSSRKVGRDAGTGRFIPVKEAQHPALACDSLPARPYDSAFHAHHPPRQVKPPHDDIRRQAC